MRIRARAVRAIFILLIAIAPTRVLFADDPKSVRLMVGRSAVIDVGTPISRVSLTSADVADAMVTSGNQLLINGKTPGTISMFVWERTGALRQYEIVVQRDLARLNEQIRKLFPGESVDAQSNGKAIVLSGVVSSKDMSAKASSVAAGYVEKPEDVVNLLQLQDTAGTQVLLKVRFAEVSRSAVTNLGSSLFTGPNGYKDFIGRSTTQQFDAPIFESSNNESKLVFGDFLNLFLFDTKHQLGTVIKALQTKGLLQTLAEPNLVAESGKEASFLAGGEFPVPIAQGSGNNASISVSYKEFGVRLNFTPVITGNRVHLKVRPEVSTLDFANGVVLQGFRIPALSTRRTETELELEDGQTFAIAGLLNNSMNSTLQKIPGIGDIPILGLLFKSKAAQKDQTELVVMITPHILPRNASGVTNSLPRFPDTFMQPLPDRKLHDAPPPAFPTPAPVRPRTEDTSAAGAAETVSNIMHPKPLPVVVQGPPPPPSPVGSQPLPAKRIAAPTSARPASSAAPNAVPAKSKSELERERKIAQEQAQRDLETARAQAARNAEAARVKAKRDAEASRLKAKRDGELARVAAEDARRQTELAKKRQKAIDDAAALAKAAEDRYQAELAKKQK